MKKENIKLNFITIFLLLFLLFNNIPKEVLGDMISRKQPQLNLSQEEKDYILKREPISAGSIDGGAPLHYKNSKGEITGIAVSVLDKIEEITGLKFEYNLYESISDVFESNDDIAFGLTPEYAPKDIPLSISFLESETILFKNASIDSNNLRDKKYASIKGGTLPNGIDKENAIFYNSREETLNAVDKGDADYGYGNEYSIAFYTLQENYKNLVSIPVFKESREYAIGLLKEDPILLSIINKSIEIIDDNQLNSIILEVASRVERKVSLGMIMDNYGLIILIIIALIIGLLLWALVLNLKVRKEKEYQNKKFNLLSKVSNEYLFEYNFLEDNLELSDKAFNLFKSIGNLEEVNRILKNNILYRNSENYNEIIKLPLNLSESGFFKVVTSDLHNKKGQTYYIIGKLINISKEVAEKENLIIASQIDGLTGIYNATTGKALMKEKIRNKKPTDLDSLILIDCDDFKEINDNFGHLKGDEALINISKVLKESFSKDDIISRIGGDEFCIYTSDVNSKDEIISICKKVIENIKSADKSLSLSVSVGIVFFKENIAYNNLFEKADKAMYEAKNKGCGKVVSKEI